MLVEREVNAIGGGRGLAVAGFSCLFTPMGMTAFSSALRLEAPLSALRGLNSNVEWRIKSRGIEGAEFHAVWRVLNISWH